MLIRSVFAEMRRTFIYPHLPQSRALYGAKLFDLALKRLGPLVVLPVYALVKCVHDATQLVGPFLPIHDLPPEMEHRREITPGPGSIYTLAQKGRHEYRRQTRGARLTFGDRGKYIWEY